METSPILSDAFFPAANYCFHICYCVTKVCSHCAPPLQKIFPLKPPLIDWLVVYLPLWKIWVRQLGSWNSPYMEKYPLVSVYIAMEHHHLLWENPLFLWPLSIAMFDITRGYSIHVPNHQPNITVQHYCSTIINYKSHVPNHQPDITVQYYCSTIINYKSHVPNHQPYITVQYYCSTIINSKSHVPNHQPDDFLI